MPKTWVTTDFEQLSWHDCHVHGFRLLNIRENEGTADLELDLDFIVEWVLRQDRTYEFRIAPATLTFHGVFGLRFTLDYATPTAGMFPFALEGIEREVLRYPTGHTSYRWRLPINWPTGEITFDSPGFTQVLRSEPFLSGGHPLRPSSG